MTTTILALDLGKFNSVLCWYESEASTPAFRSVKSTPEHLRAGQSDDGEATSRHPERPRKFMGRHLIYPWQNDTS